MHFLKNARSTNLGMIRAAVKAKYDRTKKALVLVEEAPFVLKPDTLIAPIPDDVPILDRDGKRIKGKYYVTTETFDPFHAIVELPSA